MYDLSDRIRRNAAVLATGRKPQRDPPTDDIAILAAYHGKSPSETGAQSLRKSTHEEAQRIYSEAQKEKPQYHAPLRFVDEILNDLRQHPSVQISYDYTRPNSFGSEGIIYVFEKPQSTDRPYTIVSSPDDLDPAPQPSLFPQQYSQTELLERCNTKLRSRLLGKVFLKEYSSIPEPTYVADRCAQYIDGKTLSAGND
jgi:hypothetical protein